MNARRGRPRKRRPSPGDPLKPGMSLRDIEAATGVKRRFLAKALLIASIPEEEFEALIESDHPATAEDLELLARRRAGKRTEYVRRCPHCGMPLRMEDVR